MRKLSFSLIVPALLILLIASCAAELENNMPMEQGYGNGFTGQTQPGGAGAETGYARTERTDGAGGNTGNSGRIGAGAGTVPGTGGAGLQYERGREDYPGQNYAGLVGATVPKDSGRNAGNSTPDGGPAGITGSQLSSGSGAQLNGSGLVLRSIRTPVRQGETGGLSVQGRPDTQYTITAVYRKSGNMVTSTAVKRSGDNGIVELEWNVSSQTEPGTYGVMVSGGGEQIAAAYTVIEQGY